MSVDNIANFFTIIRNALAVGKRSCSVLHSNFKDNIAAVLKKEGYIVGYSVEQDKDHAFKKYLTVQLRYVDGVPAISEIKKVSKQGRRCYKKFNNLGRVIGGLGIYIVSTNQGVLSDREVRNKCKDGKQSVLGGEVVGSVW